MISPDLISADLRPKPPAAEVGPISVIPKVEHDIEAIDLLGLLVDRLAMVLTMEVEVTTDNAAYRLMAAAVDYELLWPSRRLPLAVGV